MLSCSLDGFFETQALLSPKLGTYCLKRETKSAPPPPRNQERFSEHGGGGLYVLPQICWLPGWFHQSSLCLLLKGFRSRRKARETVSPCGRRLEYRLPIVPACEPFASSSGIQTFQGKGRFLRRTICDQNKESAVSFPGARID